MINKILTIVAIIMFGMVSSASAVVMTFNDLENPINFGNYYSFASHIEQGFEIETTGMFGVWKSTSPDYNGDAAWIQYSAHKAKLSATDGSLFTLNSIDLNKIYTGSDTTVSFKAYDINDNLLGAEGITLTAYAWVTLEFSSLFENISYIEWNQSLPPFHQFDNITLNETGNPAAPVPEPATCLLMGCGLLGFAITKRKQFFKK